jgi:hypothetical protein
MDWISVGMELPKKLEKVLFHWVSPVNSRNISVGFMDNGDWHIYLPYHSFKICPTKLKVTHWVPLSILPNYDGSTLFEGALPINEANPR